MLVTDAHESFSIRDGGTRETLRFLFYVSRPTRVVRRSSISSDGFLAAFLGWFLLACLLLRGRLAVCTGVLLGILLVRSPIHHRMVVMLFLRQSTSTLRFWRLCFWLLQRSSPIRGKAKVFWY
jgi:hypothetical protein